MRIAEQPRLTDHGFPASVAELFRRTDETLRSELRQTAAVCSSRCSGPVSLLADLIYLIMLLSFLWTHANPAHPFRTHTHVFMDLAECPRLVERFPFLAAS